MSLPPSTPATVRKCTRCRAPVLVAVDDGIPARADAAPAPTGATGLLYVLTPAGYLTWLNPDLPPPKGTRHADHRCQPAPEPEPTLF